MAAKRSAHKAKRKPSKVNAPSFRAPSMLSIATRNLVNMVVVTVTSGVVLLALLAVRRF